MTTYYVHLPPEAADRLRELARRERRSPRQQAAVLVLAGLDREGADLRPDDAPPAAVRTTRAARRAEVEP